MIMWQEFTAARRREQSNGPGTETRTGTPRPLQNSIIHLHPRENGKSQPAQDEPCQ